MNMFFASGDSLMNSVVVKPTQLCEGTTKYIISQDGSQNRHEKVKGRNARHLFRFGAKNKKNAVGRDRHLKDINPGDTVVLEFGGNNCDFDWRAISEAPCAVHAPLLSLSDFRQLYRELISQFRTLGAKPVLLSLPVLLPQRYFDYISQGHSKENILRWLGGDINKLSDMHELYNRELFKLGDELDVPVVDISTIFLDRRSLGDCYSADGMHPNKRGHAMIAEAVMSSGLLV